MLYDPKWEKTEVKADPFKLDTLIAWLEKQPADKHYDFADCSGMCLYGQYFKAVCPDLHWGTAYSRIDSEVRCGVAGMEPRNFGAALKRARALQANND